MGESKPSVLHVDHDEISRHAIAQILRQEGFETQAARTGEEALRRAGEGFDLILIDIDLPDIDGLELCRRLRSDPRTARTPLLHIAAADRTPEACAAGLDAGADGYLTQPVEARLLASTVRSLLRARAAEIATGRAARRWQAAFDAMTDGVALLDRDGRVERANRAMCALLGRPARELIGLPWDGLDSSTGAALRITVDPIVDERGEFGGAVVAAVRRERLEEALRHAPAGVIVAEAPSGKVTFANDRAEALLGSPIRIGATLADQTSGLLFHPDGTPCQPEELPLARAIAAGETVTNEVIEAARGDARATLLVNAAPIRDSAGSITAGVSVIYDVTARNQFEERLRHSQKMEAVGRLAGGVAHDFNNLLTIINGYSQMVFENLAARDPARKDMEAVIEAAERATSLTRQLLIVSRRQTAEIKPLDLNRHIAKLSRALKKAIGENIEIATALAADPARINSDPGLLEQAVMNLALNARDAMPNGGRLTIGTECVEVSEDSALARRALNPGRYVLLSVADSGSGMSADTLARALEPFFTTKPKGKGTGLGLSVVYGIVKQSGGEILLESEVGRGAVARIYFPVATGSEPADKAPARRNARKSTETILIVEDEPEVRRLTSEMLRRRGYVVYEAASGADALELWRERKDSIDLLLTDVIMPQMGGRELAERLKTSRPDLKVMYMSGYTDEVIAQHGVPEPGAAFVRKPFTPEAIARMIRSVLDKKT